MRYQRNNKPFHILVLVDVPGVKETALFMGFIACFLRTLLREHTHTHILALIAYVMVLVNLLFSIRLDPHNAINREEREEASLL